MSDVHENENALIYPFDGRPGDGAVMEMRPGVLWVRMPVPIPGLDYINLWLLRDGAGWTLVDTGFRSSRIQGLWDQVFAAHLDGLPVTRVICTHFHPDHLGLAGWICERFDAPLWMTHGEWTFGRMLSLEALPEVPPEVLRFYRRIGFDEKVIDGVKARGFGNFKKAVSEIPRAYRRIVEGEQIRIGGQHWQVIVGRGHSPEHACLFCPGLNLLISGDQVLPRISPHIGVYPGEPDADPLKLYLDSMASFAPLPDDVLVLPAHGDPFIGLKQRVKALMAHHQTRLDTLIEILVQPKTTLDVLPALFKRHSGEHAVMAAGEALAHLHLLLREGRIEKRTNVAGVDEYVLPAMAAAAQ